MADLDKENLPNEEQPVSDETERALASVMAREPAKVLPEIEGKDLAPDAPEQSAPTDDEEAPGEKKPNGISGIELAMALCDAVLTTVGRGQFHGGVRPDNISVQGTAVTLGGKLKHNVGEFTPQELEYMAPELFWDGIRGGSSDVYSIGLILYSVYNYGRLPFWPSSGAIIPNARASALQKRMSAEQIQPPALAEAELAEIILRALAFRTEERWHDVQELKDALSSCDISNGAADVSLALSGMLNRTVTQPPEQTGEKKRVSHAGDPGFAAAGRRPVKRHNLSWIWIVLLLLFIVGAVVLLLGGGDSAFGKKLPAEVEQSPEATLAPAATPVVTPAPTATAEPTATPTPNSERYVVVAEDVSWTEAVERCKEMGGKLACPMNEEELEALRIVCRRSELTFLWLGASRQADRSWMTTDGEVLTYYDFWGPGEPSFVDSGDGMPENYLLFWELEEDNWVVNDSRENPLEQFGYIYSGNIGFVCQMW